MARGWMTAVEISRAITARRNASCVTRYSLIHATRMRQTHWSTTRSGIPRLAAMATDRVARPNHALDQRQCNGLPRVLQLQGHAAIGGALLRCEAAAFKKKGLVMKFQSGIGVTEQ